jgi:hypothetical protein
MLAKQYVDYLGREMLAERKEAGELVQLYGPSSQLADP